MKRIRLTLALTATLACVLSISRAGAQGNPPGTVTVSSAVTDLESFRRDLGGGGDVSWNEMAISAGVTRQFVPAFAAGLSLRYSYQKWRFGSAAGFGTEPPWRKLHHPAAGLNLSLALSPSVLVGVSPAVEWAYDSEASAGDGLIYGAVVSALKVFGPRFVLGGGVNLSRQFYNVKTSPFVIVNWKLTDRLRVANAIPSGPEGGAGVELRYAPGAGWEFAGGGVYRGDRYRLKDRGPATGAVGDMSGIPLLARVSRDLGGRTRVDFYAGVIANGKLTLKDSGGHELTSETYKTTPSLAATVSSKL